MRYAELEVSERKKIAEAKYVSLETFRRDGRGVATPVWFAQHAGELWVFTAADAGKVKRVRGRERSTLARCNFRGVLLGPRFDTRARIASDPNEIDAAYEALRRRYGWQMTLTDLLSRVAGRIPNRAIIALRPADADSFES